MTEREETRAETIVTVIAFLSVIGAMTLVLGAAWGISALVKVITHG